MSDLVEESFGEDLDADELVAEVQIRKITENLTKDGVRDGITDGQNITLQSGFDIGYEKAFLSVEPLAAIRGCLWSLLTGVEAQSRDRCQQEVESCIVVLKELEKKTKEALQQHFATLESLSDQQKFVDISLKNSANEVEEKCTMTLTTLGVPQDFLHNLFDQYRSRCS